MLYNIKHESGQNSSAGRFLQGLEFLLIFIKALIGFMVLRINSLLHKLQPHKIIRLRYRYIFARSGKVRLRYAAGFWAIVVAGGISALSTPGTIVFPHFPQLVQNYEQAEDSGPVPYLSGNQLFGNEVKSRISESMRMATAMIKKPAKPLTQTIKIGTGDTLAGVLQQSGVDGQDVYQIMKTLKPHYDPRQIRPGQTLDIAFKRLETEATENIDEEILEFTKFEMKLSPIKEIIIQKDDGNFTAEIKEKELQEHSYGRYAEISTSLYGSAARAGIPSPVIAELIRLYSWGVDFQRDIRRGDKIEVLYKTYETDDGDFAKYGDILYANLVVNGKDMPIYRYKMENGTVDYFDPKGQSTKKTLMKTPIDGARISSGFGMRKHPVLGYNKMHKGMDFAAATGTPIYAAGNGVVEFAGRNGGYGNFVKIRHNGRLSTAYAHMHRFAGKISKGTHVHQGQVIGYVGTTGRSTGPHLHYEVLLNGKQVNPNRVDLPTGEQLKGKDLKTFQAMISSLNAQYASLAEGVDLAQLPTEKKEKSVLR